MNFLPRLFFLRLLALVSLLAGIATPALGATYTDNGDGTVTDPTTGLTWMRCSMGQTWDGSTCTGTAGTYFWDQATALTGTVTFAGQSDWRLPTVRELLTIVDRSTIGPSINTTAFPNTPRIDPNTVSSSLFWSASVLANYSAAARWVSFYSGYIDYSLKDSAYLVRLVRAGQSLGLLDVARPTSDYVDHGDGTATHTPTGLMWKRCAEGRTWDGATCTGTANSYTGDQAWALSATNFAGHADWRLPTLDELGSLVDYTRSPALNAEIFPPPTSLSVVLWSATSPVSSPNNAWLVGFDNGFLSSSWRGSATYVYQVLLVRSGQSLGSTTTTTVTSTTTQAPTTTTTTVSSTTTTTLVFVILSVSSAGTGSGVITGSQVAGSPYGINPCSSGSTCTAMYPSGSNVTLTASPASGSTFSGWSGTCIGTGGCNLTITGAMSVKATFTLNVTTPTTTTTVTTTTTTTTTTAPATTTTTSTTTTTLVGLNLSPGWNLVGNSVEASLDVAGSFGDATKVITVWKWVVSKLGWAFYTPTQNDGGAAYAAGKSYDFLTSVSGGEGFWVNAKAAFTAQLPSGSAVSSASFQSMASGWNLIAVGDSPPPSGFNKTLSVTPPTAGDIPLNLTSLWAWDATQNNWYFYAPNLEKNNGLSAYVLSKNYLDFGTKKLDPTMGFWVNKP